MTLIIKDGWMDGWMDGCKLSIDLLPLNVIDI
jgi:hypothetical protein